MHFSQFLVGFSRRRRAGREYRAGNNSARIRQQRELEHDPEKACPGLDPGWVPVFGKRSCSTKRLERDDDSNKSHPALDCTSNGGRDMSEPCACIGERAFPSRRSVIAGFALLAAASSPTRSAGASSAEDERFMRMALGEAARADFPFGALIVRDGAGIARGRNLGRTHREPTAHGEMVAIRRCLAARGPAALRGSTLYTSGEPCAMCMGAILWCHVGRLVFAASLAQLVTKLDQIMLSSADVAAKAPFA